MGWGAHIKMQSNCNNIECQNIIPVTKWYEDIILLFQFIITVVIIMMMIILTTTNTTTIIIAVLRFNMTTAVDATRV